MLKMVPCINLRLHRLVSFSLIIVTFEIMLLNTTEAKKVIIKGAETKIELPDQTISEVLIKRFKPSNHSSEVLLHKIIITRNSSAEGPLLEYPTPLQPGQGVFIGNNSFEIDYSDSDLFPNGSSFSGRAAFGKGRAVASDKSNSSVVECDDYGDEPQYKALPPKTCWSRKEFHQKMASARLSVTKNLQLCPQKLPCQEWSSCLYLWPTGLVTQKLAINPEGERTYFNLLLEGLDEPVRKEIRDFMKECYEIYGLLLPFDGQSRKRRRRRREANPPKIDIGLKNCRARILDIQECLGYGVWKALCQQEL